jgi:hypothetical protein
MRDLAGYELVRTHTPGALAPGESIGSFEIFSARSLYEPSLFDLPLVQR